MTCPLCHEPTRVGGLPCPDCLRRGVIGRPPFVWGYPAWTDHYERRAGRTIDLHGLAPDSGLLEDR